MVQWVEGHVVGKTTWSQRLVSLQVDADIAPFEAGQFIKLGLEVGAEAVGRPYSLVNAPGERPLEFCFSVVPGGPLSKRLAALNAGDSILVAPHASGFLILREVISGSHLWLIASGTGIGPFLSILKTAEPWQRFERIVLVHAARLVSELMYRDTISEFAETHTDKFVFIPFVSREPTDFALPGRIPQAIENGQLETRAGIKFSAAQSQIMLCGNPQMVDEIQQLLIERGLKKHRRREPGNISVESYW
ncbi:ferredoxin--NADP reductase [Thiobacillus denitrificans]|uniref:ferredoxin--NADP(+) reductase n=1 Tax=Thiobacillus denitrificans TaxID=36861 RepID=A0A106BKM5_THIDE|nr:ferredoxin--NADP reductase [Thiobacillus denitrificans]KVW94221.1 ferredoxin-NADP reductase [Thiobacillus denitrificans]